MSSQFTEPFRCYLPPTEDTVKMALTTGLVVFDTNVLLSAYRFAPPARQELLSAFDRVADRVWIPNRVAEEFHRSRLAVIYDYDAAYVPVIESLQSVRRQLTSDIEPKINQLANRTAMSSQEKHNLRRLIADSIDASMAAVENLRQNHGQSAHGENDTILSRYQKLFDGKTGLPFESTELEVAVAEAKRRCSLNIPPGYKDAEKHEPYGDYFVWKQTLIEAAKRKCTHLLFVTADKKEDWYQTIKGKTISARPELSREAILNSDAQLVMFDTTSFLFHAKKFLNAEVSPETIQQSKDLPSYGAIDELFARLEREEARLAHLEKEMATELEQRQMMAIRIERFASAPDTEVTPARQNHLAGLNENLRLIEVKTAKLDAERHHTRQVCAELQYELTALMDKMPPR